MNKLFSNIKGDIFGGLTSGIVALPLALAFGVSSGLGPSAGLYGAIFISFFAALFGGTNTQISGPTAPMTAVSLVIIAGIVASNNGDVNKALPAILSVFLLAGIMQIGLGLIGLGKYIRYIPYPVVSGFMTAIGVIILITQLLPTLGYYPKEDQSYVDQFKPQVEEIIINKSLKEVKSKKEEKILSLQDYKNVVASGENIRENDILNEAKALAKKNASGVLGALKLLPRAIKNIDWLELLLALGTILIIYGFKRITTKVPSTFVALIVMTAIPIFAKLDYRPIPKIPEGLPVFKSQIFLNFDFSQIQPYILSALALSLLGAIDSLLTSIVADNMTKTKHQPNRELIGQGIGNSIASLFGGIPGAGATIRTVLNINSGGKTKLSGMIAGVFLFFIVLAIAPLASKIPAAVLAGILITVGIGVMDYKGIKAIPSLPKDIQLGPLKLSSEVLIMLIVLVLSTFWDLVYAVGIGFVLASLMFMKKIGDLTAEGSNVKSINAEVWVEEDNSPIDSIENVFVKQIKGPLFFGSTSDFQALAQQIPPTAIMVIMRLDRMQYMDQSGLYAMEEMLQDLKIKSIDVLFVGLLSQPRYMMERIDIIPGLISEKHIFKDINSCFLWVKDNIKTSVSN